MVRPTHIARKSPAEGFDYRSLDSKVAGQIQAAAQRIRQAVKHTLKNIVAIGQNFLLVKASLPHGQFGPWLSAEFGWGDRTARNFMEVAEIFGPMLDAISELQIAPTAAYLLAAPSTLFEAREMAVKRAEAGEAITVELAKEIIGSFRKKAAHIGKAVPAKTLWRRVAKVLNRFQKSCDPREVREFAAMLHEFADELVDSKHD